MKQIKKADTHTEEADKGSRHTSKGGRLTYYISIQARREGRQGGLQSVEARQTHRQREKDRER